MSVLNCRKFPYTQETNVTLGAESILFKKALDWIETDFQKNYNTWLYIFFECTLYPQI